VQEKEEKITFESSFRKRPLLDLGAESALSDDFDDILTYPVLLIMTYSSTALTLPCGQVRVYSKLQEDREIFFSPASSEFGVKEKEGALLRKVLRW